MSDTTLASTFTVTATAGGTATTASITVDYARANSVANWRAPSRGGSRAARALDKPTRAEKTAARKRAKREFEALNREWRR